MTHPIEDPEHKYLREEEGRELRALRIRAGLTQVELAAAVKMTPLSIVMAEHGKKALDEAKDLANKLNLKGTPLYLIGDRMVSGAPDDLFDQLKAKVAEIREKGCASTC